jgi:hypothetical protein
VVLAHGGAAGAAIELAVFVVPLLVFGFLWWWAARRSDGRDDAET